MSIEEITSEAEDLTQRINKIGANAVDFVERHQSFRYTLRPQVSFTEGLNSSSSIPFEAISASTSLSSSQPSNSVDLYPIVATLTDPTTLSTTDEHGIFGLKHTDSTEALWNSGSDRSSESSMSSSINLSNPTDTLFNNSVAEGFGCHLPIYDDSLKESHEQELLEILEVKDDERQTVFRKLKAASGMKKFHHLPLFSLTYAK